MSDTPEFYAILTEAGRALQFECLNSNKKFTMCEMAVGDGNGSYYEPEKSQTDLKNPCYKHPITRRMTDENNLVKSVILDIPEEITGFTIREVGVYGENGELLIIGKYPETPRLKPESGAVSQQAIKVNLTQINELVLPVLIDPSINTASVEYVEKYFQKTEEKGIPEGYASLNNLGRVPKIQLPMYFEADKLYYYDENNELKEFKSGGGLKPWQIGMAPYVDEKDNTQRILNGQIVSADVIPEYSLDKLLEIKALDPDLFTTEENWQAESALNIDGCVYKYVINYASDGTTVESVRLPKYPDYIEIIGGTAPSGGDGKTMGLQGIGSDGIHYMGLKANKDYAMFTNNGYGQELTDKTYTSGSIGSDRLVGLSLDPSKSGVITHLSSATYKLRLKYYVQIATGAETEVIVNNQLEILSGAVLFEPKFSDTPLYDIQYGAKGATISKVDYPDAYNGLLVEVNPDIAVGTTVNISDTFSYTKRGLSVKETGASDITDNDWTVNRANETFTLPLASSVYPNMPSNIYLYFCIATVGQNAAIANLGRVEESLVNKVDITNTQWAVSACMPDYTAGVTWSTPTGGTWTAPYDCRIAANLDQQCTFIPRAVNASGTPYLWMSTYNNNSDNAILDVPKGTVIYMQETKIQNKGSVIIYPFKGDKK